jgi:biopolymer transport protein ExbD
MRWWIIALVLLAIAAIYIRGRPHTEPVDRRVPVDTKVEGRAIPSTADVAISNEGTCTLDDAVVSCDEIGERIRERRLPDDVRISVDAAANAPLDVIKAVLRSIEREHYSNYRFVTQTRKKDGGP